jgi:hypothetical protein
MLSRRVRTAGTLCVVTAALMGLPRAVAADVITEWGARGVAIGTEKQMPNAPLTRNLAIMHVAMFEAVNAIDRRYKPYKLALPAEKTASKDAAAAAAAHAVLASLYPDQQQKLDEALQASLTKVAEGDARTKGVELGKKAAAGILALRADDGTNAVESYRPFTKPGVYVPTALPIETTSGGIKPWVMERASQFLPAPPPALDSEVWTRDVNEIRSLGGIKSTARTQEQTEIGRFWFFTGPRTYVPLAQQIAEAQKMDVVDCARLFALLSMATSDAFIAVFDAKYFYNFWRPITAIRNADLTSNLATAREASWTPLGSTPAHPEYPCAHCIVAAAVAEVLQAVVEGDVGQLTLASPLAPGVARKWKRLADYRDEVALARIYAGFHYRFSTEAAKVMGTKIGELTVRTQLVSAAEPKTTKQ